MKEMEKRQDIESVEILPEKIGELSGQETSPLLERAASRIEIVRPKTEFWRGMTENLRGAGAFLTAKKADLGSRAFRAIAGASLVATMVSACARPTEGDYTLPIQSLPTATEIFTPTLEATPTTEASATPEAAVINEWRLSPDGHIYYNEAELYGGLFTINPENTTAYWEDLVKGLYRINLYFGDTTFLSRYPTEERFLDAISSGEPIEGLCIPVQHPTRLRQWQGAIGCSSPMGPVNLSSVAIVIDQPTREEMLDHGPSDFPPYIFFDERLGELYVEVIEREGNQILEFHFRRDVVYEEPNVRPLLADGTQDDNLVAATELLNSLNFVIGLLPERPPRDNFYLRDELRPPALYPIFNLTRGPTSYSSLSETDSSLIMLR